VVPVPRSLLQFSSVPIADRRLTRSCDQCGAVYDDGTDCESCFHALLAYENERPAAFGAVHHLTVATYYLQHPAGYTRETLAHWREILARSLDGTASVRELRDLAGRRFAGSKRVREEDATAPAWWPRTWPMTVQAVFTPDTPVEVDTYVYRAREWARQARTALDAVERPPDD
jgi:uncharacterized protein DUF5946